ncbi:hypothetical protein TSOC_001127 [Tetrabaena socialis]|uniref:C3HC-type domain-containing protein n=1 Tax=Tetrabaena socialis TaxID=47790 RepID=A0A2J8AHJ7_9CHLO|nr:hypothetical protein TSOC_001127 [Tetrabaena socialis]|eukprot:PNH11995.1 hypothetical protein TSOC_001127 [Tetrabaena socialis]
MASVYERISSALSSLGKRRERDGGSQEGAGGRTPSASPAARAPKRFRPWEQSDLHRRLESYKPLTWFAKPASVGPIPCSLRGWVNEACDTLGCEYCGARLIYPPQVPYDQRQAAADLPTDRVGVAHPPLAMRALTAGGEERVVVLTTRRRHGETGHQALRHIIPCRRH